MGRFVKPEKVRLYLADTYTRTRHALAEQVEKKQAKPEDLAAAEAREQYALTLGDWIDVKRRLNTGETQAMFARLASHITPGEATKWDTRATMTSKVLAYLLAWSLKDDDGQAVPYPAPRIGNEAERLAMIDNLDPETFREIREAIDYHEEQVDKEVEAQKKIPSGLNESPATSPSADAWAGPIQTSRS